MTNDAAPLAAGAEPAGAGTAGPEDLDWQVFERIKDELGGSSGPANYARAVRDLLDELVDAVGEGWVGGPWEPKADLWQHTTKLLDDVGREERGALRGKLTQWSRELGSPGRIYLAMYLWHEAFWLWDRGLAYRAIRFLSEAAADLAGQPAREPGGTPERWDVLAWRAVCGAIGCIAADTEVFKQTSLSSQEGLADAISRALGTQQAPGPVVTARVMLGEAAGALGPAAWRPDDASHVIWRGLRHMKVLAGQLEIFYDAIGDVTQTMIEFGQWLADAAALGQAAGPTPPLAANGALVASIDDSLSRLREAQGRLGGSLLSECEPWEGLLSEVREIVTTPGSTVLLPKRTWIRYCYPFAVEEPPAERVPLRQAFAHRRRGGEDRAGDRRERLHARLQGEFGDMRGNDAAGRFWMTVGEPEDLIQTEFFQNVGSEEGMYGGDRVTLSDVEFTGGRLTGTGKAGPRCKVWLDLNWMGNLCLCVEPAEPLQAPLPSLTYRTFRAGTPFVFGEEVRLAEPVPGAWAGQRPPAWDCLDSFARDVIRATADARYWKEGKDARLKEGRDKSAVAPHRRGNLHVAMVVQTEARLGTQSEEITRRLDGALGGRILLRSIQRPASTLEEWLRFPPQQHKGGRGTGVAAVPELGYTGDWFVHTGETTVFGIVAVPGWFRDVYPETAEFVCSWSPLLRLWNQRLDQAIRNLRMDKTAATSDELRTVEQRVRLHLARINSEELTATLAYRRFLDEMLQSAGVGRLEEELQAQLEAAEQLTDWVSATKQQKSATRRDVWLFIIALLGVFSLGDFMLLVNSTHLHANFLFFKLPYNGTWEDWLILGLFFAALLLGSFFVLGMSEWLSRRLTALRHPYRSTSRRARRSGRSL